MKQTSVFEPGVLFRFWLKQGKEEILAARILVKVGQVCGKRYIQQKAWSNSECGQTHLFWRLRHMKLGTVSTLFHPLWPFQLFLGDIKHLLLADGEHSENQEKVGQALWVSREKTW